MIAPRRSWNRWSRRRVLPWAVLVAVLVVATLVARRAPVLAPARVPVSAQA